MHLKDIKGLDADSIAQLLEGLAPDELKQIKDMTRAKSGELWKAQIGPQADAFYSPADELLYGGAAGGGKTDLLLGLALTSHTRSLLFRRQSTDLDGLWERLLDLTPLEWVDTRNGVKKRQTIRPQHGFRLVEMGHLEADGSEKTWQGRPHDFIGFDEAAQLAEQKVLFVCQWLRSASPGQRQRVVFATNPPIPDLKNGRFTDASTGDWLKRWFAPWLDANYPNPAQPGELRWCYVRQVGEDIETVWVSGPGRYDIETGERMPDDPDEQRKRVRKLGSALVAHAKSRTFIRSLVHDNAYLAGTGYLERLSATPEPLRSLLLEGKFGIKLADHPMQVIPTNWILAAQRRWHLRQDGETNERPPMLLLAADIAQGGVDNSTIVSLDMMNTFSPITRRPGTETPTGFEVMNMLMMARRNNALVVLDGTGGWGGSTRDLLLSHHGIRAVMHIASENMRVWTSDGRFKLFNERSAMWWFMREALDPDNSEYNIALPPDDTLLAQLSSAHWGLRENTIIVESKDAIRSRIGSSTDHADVVLMAWSRRKMAEMMLLRSGASYATYGARASGEFSSDDMAVPLADPLANW